MCMVALKKQEAVQEVNSQLAHRIKKYTHLSPRPRLHLSYAVSQSHQLQQG
jgi:hypothetical protein